MLTRTCCLKKAHVQTTRVSENCTCTVLVTNEYMQTRVYYNLHPDTRTRTCINVNAALDGHITITSNHREKCTMQELNKYWTNSEPRSYFSRPKTMFTIRGEPDPDPDPAGYPVNFMDPGRIRIQCIWIQFGTGSEVGSGKYWPDVHNYDIKHHGIFPFQEMTHDNTEL